MKKKKAESQEELQNAFAMTLTKKWMARFENPREAVAALDEWAAEFEAADPAIQDAMMKTMAEDAGFTIEGLERM